MRITTTRITVTKRHALTISRGTETGSVNVVVEVEHDGVVGLGEMAPNDVTGDHADTTEAAVAIWQDALAEASPLDRQSVRDVLGADPMGSAGRAALDLALFDWLGKRAGLPVWQMLGADPSRIAPTSS